MTNSKLKDSNIEWLGKIPRDWKVKPLYLFFFERKNKNNKGKEKNLLSLSYGKIIQKDINSTGGLLPQSYNTYNVIEAGDIIIRPTDLQNDKHSLRTALSKEHGIITSAYIDLAPLKDTNSEYFHYVLHAYDIEKVFYNMGNGVRQGLNYSEFSKLKLPIPSSEEQKEIVNFLNNQVSQIDKLSKKIQQEITDLEKYRRSIITKAVTKGIDKNVPMKDSGIDWIGKIPKNWDLEKVKFLCTKLERGTTPDYTEAHCTKVINQATFSKGFFDDKNIKYSTKNAQSSRGLVQKGDVLIASTGGGVLGKVFYFNQNGIYVADSHVTILRTNNKYKSKLAYYILSVNYELINGLMAQGSTNQIELQRDLLANFYLPVPDSKNQKDIITFLDNKCSKIKQIINYKQHELNKLAHYKQAIIYEYVTGKKQVPKDEGAKA